MSGGRCRGGEDDKGTRREGALRAPNTLHFKPDSTRKREEGEKKASGSGDGQQAPIVCRRLAPNVS